jgi:hypothetical protein
MPRLENEIASVNGMDLSRLLNILRKCECTTDDWKSDRRFFDLAGNLNDAREID